MRRVRIEAYGGMLDPNDPSSQRPGYYNLKNDQAISETGRFQNNIKKHYDDVLKMATNDSVKRMLSASFTGSYNSHYNSSAKYHIRQRDNVNKMVSAARSQEAVQHTILAPTNEEYQRRLAVVTCEREEQIRSQGFTEPE